MRDDPPKNSNLLEGDCTGLLGTVLASDCITRPASNVASWVIEYPRLALLHIRDYSGYNNQKLQLLDAIVAKYAGCVFVSEVDPRSENVARDWKSIDDHQWGVPGILGRNNWHKLTYLGQWNLYIAHAPLSENCRTMLFGLAPPFEPDNAYHFAKVMEACGIGLWLHAEVDDEPWTFTLNACWLSINALNQDGI